jgi:hypothetical protein
VHQKTLLLVLATAVLFDFTGCSSMSAQARRERAYRHYAAKQMKKRQKEMARAQKAANRDMKHKMQNMQPSEPQVTTSLQDVSPQYPSVFEPVSEPKPSAQTASLLKEPTVDPITVSASDSMPSEPPQP